MFEQTVSGFWLKGILATAQSKGIDQQHVLAHAGVVLSKAGESNHTNNETHKGEERPSDWVTERVPLDATVKIWNAAIELTKDAMFGYHMGRQFRPNWFHLIHHLWANSPNVEEAIRTALAYQPLISDGGEISLDLTSEHAIIEYHPKAARLAFSYHQVDAVLTILVSLVRWSVDDQFAPSHVLVPHDPHLDAEEFQAFFQSPIEYNAPVTRLMFDRRWLSSPMIGADPDLLEMHKQLADKKLAELGRADLSTQIVNKLNVLGQFQNLSKETVAEQLGLSSRTLQRKLQAEGTNFTGLSDQLRKSLAESYIAQGLSTNELVSKLDFQEISSLHKACKRWFGCSLQQKRED